MKHLNIHNAILMLVCSIFSLQGNAQTIVIDPTTNGGFETGTTLASNGWTVVNAAANQWAVGNGSVYAGTRGAYIGTPTTFIGTNTATISHFYRDVVIPAGAINVQLSFKYYQPVTDNGYDSFYVATTTVGSVPVANVTLDGTYTRWFQNTGTLYPAYTTIGPIDLTSLAGSTVRLVFSYRNDGANPIGIPALDNVMLVYCLPPVAQNVTGGGTYCSSDPGVHVGLDGSQAGIIYNLSDGSSTVATLAGSGGALDFGVFATAGTYTVVGMNSTAACATDMTGSTPVSMAAPVMPAVSVVPDATSVCPGTAVTFAAMAINGGTTPSYQWAVNGSPVGLDTDTYTYVPIDGAVVSVMVTTGGICAAVPTATNSFTVALAPTGAPSVSISADPGASSCVGRPVTYTAVPTLGGSAPTYLWTKNGINVATGPSLINTPADGDIYSCTITSNYACRTADIAVSSDLVMSVLAGQTAPAVTIAAYPGTNIAVGESDTLVASVTGGTPARTYLWHVNGIPVPGATNAVFVSNTLANGDIVTCKVANTDVCGNSTLSSVTIAVNALGVAGSNTKGSELTVFPNPGRGSFFVQCSFADVVNGEVPLIVINTLGKNIYNSLVMVRNGAVNEQVLLDGATPGTYMLRIGTGANSKVVHFVVAD
jgi:hypothetical protein